VLKGEIETWLDIAPVYLKEIVFAFKKMNDNLGGKMDQMLDKQDQMIGKMDQMLGKMDQMIGKQDELLDE
jgi:hypothetical protein